MKQAVKAYLNTFSNVYNAQMRTEVNLFVSIFVRADTLWFCNTMLIYAFVLLVPINGDITRDAEKRSRSR